jgi:hypothetical protein
VRLDPLHVLVPLVVAVAAAVFLALDTSASGPCDAAQERLDNGQVAEAGKGFTAVLADDPGSPCAKKGMQSVQKTMHDTQCDDADKARKAHMLSEALKGYQALLAKDPGDECGTEGVAAVVREFCARAKVLADHKAGEAAQKAYAAILAIEPLETVEPCPAEGLVSVPSAPGTPEIVVVRGVDGSDGAPGKDGTAGKDGTPGKDGAPGKDGKVIVLDGKG